MAEGRSSPAGAAAAAADQHEVEHAAHILLQASVSTFPVRKTLSGAAYPDLIIRGTVTQRSAFRTPLSAFDSRHRSQAPDPLSLTPNKANVPTSDHTKVASSSEAIDIHFQTQESFEEWAIGKLQDSLPEVVIEKKRSAKTTTISCRNRRSEAAGGTACSWVLKATMVGVNPIDWVTSYEDQRHNAACLQRMKSKLAEKKFGLIESVPASSLNENQHISKPHPTKVEGVIRPSDDSSEESTSEEEEESPIQLRKRKANHPGNALPSRARRYRW